MDGKSVITETNRLNTYIAEYQTKDWYILWGKGDERDGEGYYDMEGDQEKYVQVRTPDYTLLLVTNGT